MKKEKTEVIVIGAGPSGIVSASYLHKNGIKVTLLEKAIFPRFSIGESLLPQSMDNFEEAGLLEALKKEGFQKKFGARFIRKKEISEFMFKDKFGNGWDWTWQVPRADFDNALAEEAIRKGVTIEFGATISTIAIDEKVHLIFKDKEGEERELSADFIIDSSGNGRVLAKQLALEAPPKIAQHASIFTQIKEANRPQGKEGEQISFEILNTQIWFWYIPFSNGNSSIGFVGPRDWFNGFFEKTDIAFKEMLLKLNFYKNRFDEYLPLFSPVKVENISKNVTKLYGEKFVLTGNSAEFLDPIFSSGVSFATYSGLLAAKLIIKTFEGKKVDWETEYAEAIKKGVNVFASYVKSWYSGELQEIVFHKNPNQDIREKICAVLA
ncbi:MAG: NAD(P)/FAD-dependent oxidoreductase, partial [Gillisia sp.]